MREYIPSLIRGEKMTYQEAIRILHPDTTLEALAEYEYYGGFNGREYSENDGVYEECCYNIEGYKPIKRPPQSWCYVEELP